MVLPFCRPGVSGSFVVSRRVTGHEDYEVSGRGRNWTMEWKEWTRRKREDGVLFVWHLGNGVGEQPGGQRHPILAPVRQTESRGSAVLKSSPEIFGEKLWSLEVQVC